MLDYISSLRGDITLVTVLKDLQTKHGGCQAIDGVAGSGKTFLAAVYSAAMSAETDRTEKIVYLAKNYKTRDLYTKLLRSLSQNNADIVSLNEVPDDAQVTDWNLFDEFTQKTLENLVGYLQAKIDVLKEEINALMVCNATSEDKNWATILDKTDTMKALSTKLCKAKTEATITYLEDAKVLALTVDSYIMITSGSSVFAPIFATFKPKMFYRCFCYLDLSIITQTTELNPVGCKNKLCGFEI